MYRVSPHVRHFARALIGGMVVATAWVNLAPDSYYDAVEFRLADLPLPQGVTALQDSLTPMSLVSGGLMALVLAFLGKEFWESLVLERSGLRRHGLSLLPAAAVLGGSLGGILMWLAVQSLLPLPDEAQPGAGWPLPIGADVILAYALGRITFGPNHPALHLLLLIGVAFDVLGLLIAGLAYPSEGLKPLWLLLSALGVLLAWALAARHAHPRAPETRRQRAMALWPYVLGGVLSWAGITASGLPGALGLLPVIPIIPHADRTFGLFAEAESHLHDPLNRLARALARPILSALFLFGLTKGGLDLQAASPVTLTTLAAFWLGKPLGLVLCVVAALAAGWTRLPQGMTRGDLVRLAVLLGAGFTIPALAIDASLPGGAMAEAARLGLALTFLPALALALTAWAQRR